MDEPWSALDPISTQAIGDLIGELKAQLTSSSSPTTCSTARVSDRTAFVNLAGVGQAGRLVEYADTAKIFCAPQQQSTQHYVSGRFG